MQRFFPAITSAAIASSTAFLGAKALGIKSVVTLIEINALGNFSLSLALGTLLETLSLAYLLTMSIKDSLTGAPVALRLKNIAVSGTAFTLREILGAAVGYFMFTLMNESTNISASTFLKTVGVGSLLFATSIPIIIEILKKITPIVSKSAFDLLADNVTDIHSALERRPSLRP